MVGEHIQGECPAVDWPLLDICSWTSYQVTT